MLEALVRTACLYCSKLVNSNSHNRMIWLLPKMVHSLNFYKVFLFVFILNYLKSFYTYAKQRLSFLTSINYFLFVSVEQCQSCLTSTNYFLFTSL